MKRNIPFLALKYATYALGLVAAVLGLAAGFSQFESGTHYFLRGAALPVVALLVSILGVCTALVAGFLNPDRSCVTPCRISLLPPAAGFLASVLILCFLGESPAKVSLRLAVIAAILLFFSAVYCVLSFLLKDPKYRGALALLGFFPVLAPAVLAFFFYFDKTVEMNSPIKVVLQTALLFAMFLFLYQVRALLGKPLPRLLDGLRLAFFPVAALADGMILAVFFSGDFRRVDYLLGVILLLTLQIALLFDFFPEKEQ